MIDYEFYIKTLEKELLKRCRKNTSYSLNAFSKHLGISQGHLSKVLSGKSKLSLKSAHHISETLDLNENEKEEFLISVSLHNNPDRMILTQKMSTIIENPIFVLILNSLKLDDIEKSDYALSKKLKISLKTMQLYLKTLEDFGLIQKSKNQWTRVYAKTIAPDETCKNSQKVFHRAILNKAIDSIDQFQSQDRHISGVTIAVNKSQMNVAVKEINSFRERLTRILEDGDRSEVYHLEVSLFPLSAH